MLQEIGEVVVTSAAALALEPELAAQLKHGACFGDAAVGENQNAQDHQ
jgi:hypothetical protein